MRNKRKLALIMAMVLTASTVITPKEEVRAEEVAEQYIIMTKNDETFEEVIEENAENIVENENAMELKEQQIAVLELTQEEVEKMQADKDIALVEENIVLEAFNVDSFGITKDNAKNKKSKQKGNKDNKTDRKNLSKERKKTK